MIVLIGTFRFAFKVQVVCSSSSTIIVPNDYPTIQEAINAADSGDTIYVTAGMYPENIVVDKSVLIVGEDSSVTVVDGMGHGHVIHVEADDVSITGLTITNSSKWPYIGLFVEGKNCNINENNIVGNYYGIYLSNASNNRLRGNIMAGNTHNFAVWAQSRSGFMNDIDTSNKVNGKPVYYWIDERDTAVSTDAGYVALINCTNITVKNLSLTNNKEGVLLAFTERAEISENNITDNQDGIWVYRSFNNTIWGNSATANLRFGIGLWNSSSNSISRNNIVDNGGKGIMLEDCADYNHIAGNTVSLNDYALWLSGSGNNKIFHNNFINNTYPVGLFESFNNTWDNGYPFGGNYWSDYTGIDSDHDAIGDFPYMVTPPTSPPELNEFDNYPLMGIFSDFDVSLDHRVNIISNSTLEDLRNFESNSTIRLYVSNMTRTQAFGFCRVCVPKSLMPPPYTVIIDDGLTEVLHFNGTIYDNSSHRWIYFAYEHSTHRVDIIPEFPSFIILPLFMLTTLLAVIAYRRKHSFPRGC